MNQTVKIIQALIDNKEWGKLSEPLHMQNFLFNGYQNYNYNDEFFNVFLTTEKYHKTFLKAITIQNWSAELLENFLKTANSIGFIRKLSENELHTWFSKLIKIVQNVYPKMTKDRCSGVVIDHTYKPALWFKMLINDKSKLEYWSNVKTGHFGISLTDNIFNELTDDELKGLPDVLTFNGTVQLKDKLTTYDNLHRMFDSEIALISWLNTIDIIEHGRVFVHKDPDEILNLIQEHAIGNFNALQKWVMYFNVTNTEVPDELFEHIHSERSYRGGLLTYIVEQLTRQQMEKATYLNPEAVARRKDGLEILDLRGIKNEDFSNTRVFELDEIKKYPQFFDPGSLVVYLNQYVDAETFKLLNRAWKKRQRYNTALTRWDLVFRRHPKTLSIDNIKYALKHGLTNEGLLTWGSDIANAMGTFVHDKYTRNRLLTVMNVYKRYTA